MKPEQIIVAPILTEKSNAQREKHVYVFRVNKKANKIQIAHAVSVLFHVKVKKCRVAIMKGKPKRVRAVKGLTASWKKAIVTLLPGERIEIFEGA